MAKMDKKKYVDLAGLQEYDKGLKDSLSKLESKIINNTSKDEIVYIEIGDIDTFSQTAYDTAKSAIDSNKIVVMIDCETDRYIATSSDSHSISFSTMYGVCIWWNDTKKTEWVEYVSSNDFDKHTHNFNDLENKPNIESDESDDSLVITDSQGNIVAKIDQNGVDSVDLKINGKSVSEHTHDEYAPKEHSHDETYAPKEHSHDNYVEKTSKELVKEVETIEAPTKESTHIIFQEGKAFVRSYVIGDGISINPPAGVSTADFPYYHIIKASSGTSYRIVWTNNPTLTTTYDNGYNRQYDYDKMNYVTYWYVGAYITVKANSYISTNTYSSIESAIAAIKSANTEYTYYTADQKYSYGYKSSTGSASMTCVNPVIYSNYYTTFTYHSYLYIANGAASTGNTATATNITPVDGVVNDGSVFNDYKEIALKEDIPEIPEIPEVDLSNHYTKDETDDLLWGKADSEHTHDNYAPADHDHNDTYYTKSEVDTKIANSGGSGGGSSEGGSYDPNHTHDFSDLTNNPIEIDETDDSLTITDQNGNIIAKIDANGVNTVDLLINGKPIRKIFVGTQAEYEAAYTNGEVPEGTVVIITDDTEDSGGSSNSGGGGSSGGSSGGVIPTVESIEDPTGSSPTFVMYEGQLYALVEEEE